VAVRVRAINGAGKGEWSMRQIEELGEEEEWEAGHVNPSTSHLNLSRSCH